MINIYKKIRKEDKRLINILFIVILFSIYTNFIDEKILLNYTIYYGGGVQLVEDIITVDSKNKPGDYYSTYVATSDASPITYVYAKVRGLDIVKNEGFEMTKDLQEFLNTYGELSHEDSNYVATIVAFQEANKDIELINEEIKVLEADKKLTNIKPKDIILKINNKDIKTNEDITVALDEIKTNTTKVLVLRNGKEILLNQKINKINNEKKIGIVITESYDLKTDPNVDMIINDYQGSSAGIAYSLFIYDKITPEKLTNKKVGATGEIDLNGDVLPVGGIKYKLQGAVEEKLDIFLVSNDKNYEEAIKEKKKNNYDIEIIGVNTFKDAIKKLKNT